MQKTVMVRRANKLSAAIGKHFTVQKVISEGEKRFGFAIDDEGNNAFIPKPVILKHQMTSADEGAGFTAPTRQAPVGDANSLPQVMLPLVWDGEAEEVKVEETEPERDYDGEIDTLISKLEQATKLVGAIDGLITKADVFLREAENIKHVATFCHNEMTELAEWLGETYPEEDDAV